ncbi:MAG: DUF349 domain-containing protein [Endomicrobiia bacterium]
MIVAPSKEWQDFSKEIIELQKVWKTIGFTPKKNNNEIYERFRAACDKFFKNKRTFFENINEKEEHNKQLKLDLCNQAEALQNSTEWKATTDSFIHLQKEWKNIGPVPRKDADKLWKRFRAACDTFFKAKEEYFSQLDKEQDNNLKKKLDIINKIEKLQISSDNQEEVLAELKLLQKEWSEIGFIPLNKKEEIQNKYRELINAKFEKLSIDDSKKKMLKYKVKLESISTNKFSDDKLSFERNKLETKLKQLNNEILLLENNIGFFSKSKNTQSLVNEVMSKIEKGKKEIELIQEQIRLLNKVEKNSNQE